MYRKNEILIIKPILRPLSDLTKEIEGTEFTYEGVLNNFFGGFELNQVSNNKSFYPNLDEWVSFLDMHDFLSKLFEWHFDVFGLIDKGLAIDVNTLNQE